VGAAAFSTLRDRPLAVRRGAAGAACDPGRSNAADSLSALLQGAEWADPQRGAGPSRVAGGTTRPLGDQAEGTQGGVVASTRAAREKAGGPGPSQASRLLISLPFEAPSWGRCPRRSGSSQPPLKAR